MRLTALPPPPPTPMTLILALFSGVFVEVNANVVVGLPVAEVFDHRYLGAG